MGKNWNTPSSRRKCGNAVCWDSFLEIGLQPGERRIQKQMEAEKRRLVPSGLGRKQESQDQNLLNGKTKHPQDGWVHLWDWALPTRLGRAGTRDTGRVFLEWKAKSFQLSNTVWKTHPQETIEEANTKLSKQVLRYLLGSRWSSKDS